MIKILDLEGEQALPVLTRFQEFIEYEDVLFHLLRVLGQILKNNKKDVDEKFLKNLMQLLEHVTLRSGPLKGEEKPKLFCFGMYFEVKYARNRQSYILYYRFKALQLELSTSQEVFQHCLASNLQIPSNS